MAHRPEIYFLYQTRDRRRVEWRSAGWGVPDSAPRLVWRRSGLRGRNGYAALRPVWPGGGLGRRLRFPARSAGLQSALRLFALPQRALGDALSRDIGGDGRPRHARDACSFLQIYGRAPGGPDRAGARAPAGEALHRPWEGADYYAVAPGEGRCLRV